MKLTAILLLAACLQVTANSHSQTITLSEKNASLEKIFTAIKAQSGYTFVYRDEWLKLARNVDIHLQNASIRQVLDACFKNQPLTYTIVRTAVVIRLTQKKGSGDAGADSSDALPPVDAKGKVTDEEGRPLQGVSVTVKGSGRGTKTDNSGLFILNGIDEKNVLVFSIIGYQTQEITVGKQEALSIRLIQVQEVLDDVVVIGYGTSKKKDISGAVTSVNLNKVDEIPLTSIDQALTGRAGGVQINQSNGQAGAGTSIRIRGGNSLNGTNEPLFVIDGFPIINDNAALAASGPAGLTDAQSGNSGQANPNGVLNWLNPADIQSIEVLKDASATAIYGSRGANGVIIITTKKGKTGQARLNFNTSVGLSQLNESKINLMNGREFATYRNLYAEAMGWDQIYVDTTIEGKFFPNPSKIGEGTHWLDAVKRNGAAQNYSLDFSGGREVVYSGSIGWLSQEAPLIGSQFKRANFRLNLQTNLNPWLSLDNTTTYSQTTADNSPADTRDASKYGLFEAVLFANPAEPIYNPDGTLNYVGMTTLNIPAIQFSPISLGTDVLNRNSIQTFLDNLSLKAKIIPGLSAEVRGSVFSNALLRDIYYNSKTTWNGANVGGLGAKNSNNFTSYLIEAFANYDKIFGKNRFTAVAGYSYQTSANRTINSAASGFPNDNLKNENLASGNTSYPIQTNRIEDLLSSYYVRLNNIYNDKYIVTFTARYDGSSKFVSPNQWSFFPSGAVSWRISQEDFLKNSKKISDLKLRLSYGLSGNQAVQSLQTKSILGFTQYPYGGVLQTAIVPAVLGNAGLKWETTSQFNAGIDFGFWNQRLSGSFNYYIKNTKDLLQNLPLPNNSGFATQLSNVGSISNKGFELDLRADIVNGENFRWGVNANISGNKQRMTDLGQGGIDTLLMPLQISGGRFTNVALIEDQPVGVFFGFVSDGIFRTDAELAAGPALSGSRVGSRRFKDLNKDGQITDQDRQVIGDPNPDFTFGITNNFSYKGFDLNFLLQGVVGGNMWNLGDVIQEEYGYNRSKATLDYWTPSNINARYPAPGQVAGYNYYSDFNVESASYLRLKSINLGYNFPVQSIKFLRSVRLYVSGTNLLTFTKYTGFDPEVNSFGQSSLFRNIDIWTIPLYKTYTVGLNVGF